MIEDESRKKENILLKKARKIVKKLGILKSLIIFVTISSLISVSLTLLLFNVCELYIEPEILSISIVIPLVVYTTIALLLFQILLNLDTNLKKLDDLLKKDDLTQVFNKKHFLKKAKELFNRGKANSSNNFAIIMIDVDYFKKVNDRHGHLAGDNVLYNIAKIISQNVRKDDLVARYGGEEFVILLSDVDQIKVEYIAERIREKIEQTAFIYKNKTVKCTISAGISFFNDEMLNIDELLSKADHALYGAKNSGRNCVVLK